MNCNYCFFKDLKLNTMKINLLPMIVQLLYQLAADLKLEEYVYHYWKDHPLFCKRNYLGVSNLNIKNFACRYFDLVFKL